MSGKRPEAYIAEVFGFPVDVRDADVERFRSLALCPFRPIHPDAKRDLSLPERDVPFTRQFGPCTKGKKNDPLGVCSVYADGKPCVTCPVRFGEGGVMVGVTAGWVSSVLGVPSDGIVAIPEVRLVPAATRDAGAETEPADDAEGAGLLASQGAQDPAAQQEQEAEQAKSAGNIDYVLAHIDSAARNSRHASDHHVNAYAALEVQAVYISGNVRNPFEAFMKRSAWDGRHPPRPDWLSSSRKRLVPQLAWKGSVLNAWNKPIAVCVQQAFWATMPYVGAVTTGNRDSAAFREVAWVIVDLERDGRVFRLRHVETRYSQFSAALLAATQTPAGVDDLLRQAIIKKYIKQKNAKGAAGSRSPRSSKARRTGP